MHEELIEQHKNLVAKRMAGQLDNAIAELPLYEGLSPFLASQAFYRARFNSNAKGIPLNELTPERIMAIAWGLPDLSKPSIPKPNNTPTT